MTTTCDPLTPIAGAPGLTPRSGFGSCRFDSSLLRLTCVNSAGLVQPMSITFFGTAAPGSVAGNLPGDAFLDTTGHVAYICGATSGTAAPACTSVAAGGWIAVPTTLASLAIAPLTTRGDMLVVNSIPALGRVRTRYTLPVLASRSHRYWLGCDPPQSISSDHRDSSRCKWRHREWVLCSFRTGHEPKDSHVAQPVH